MPSDSQDQQRAMAIAEHNPKKLFARNKSMLKLSHKQLHDFASTPRKGLPKHSPSETKAGRVLAGKSKPPKNMGALSGAKG
jgi:hypothetical protein